MAITEDVIAFRDERGWGKFHTRKNLAQAIAIEAGELLEVFLWDRLRYDMAWERACEELADVLIYAYTLAHELGVTPESIMRAKMAKNAERYPVDESRDNALKPGERG